jgi:hypothetical protein
MPIYGKHMERYNGEQLYKHCYDKIKELLGDKRFYFNMTNDVNWAYDVKPKYCKNMYLIAQIKLVNEAGWTLVKLIDKFGSNVKNIKGNDINKYNFNLKGHLVLVTE